MTEPSDEEMERAERIRQLRMGRARSRSRERRQQRREAADDRERTAEAGHGDAAAGADDATADDATVDEADDEAAADAAAADEAAEALAAADRVDVVEMAENLPDDGSLFVLPVHDRLRREFNKVAEELHLGYGFRYEHELDEQEHLRPLALHLGVRALEDADAEGVKELLESVDYLEPPDGDAE